MLPETPVGLIVVLDRPRRRSEEAHCRRCGFSFKFLGPELTFCPYCKNTLSIRRPVKHIQVGERVGPEE